MKIEDKINKYLKEGKNWSGKVETKWHPPEGLFKNGSPEEIASTVSQGANLKTAMARLNFFLNRGGSNVSPAIRKKVEKAKKILSGSKE
jgi:hypothetical protein